MTRTPHVCRSFGPILNTCRSVTSPRCDELLAGVAACPSCHRLCSGRPEVDPALLPIVPPSGIRKLLNPVVGGAARNCLLKA